MPRSGINHEDVFDRFRLYGAIDNLKDQELFRKTVMALANECDPYSIILTLIENHIELQNMYYKSMESKAIVYQINLPEGSTLIDDLTKNQQL